MRKRDGAIKDVIKIEELTEIIKNTETCYLGMANNNEPYVLGFCFGYENGNVFLHLMKEGKKYEFLKQNNRVCLFFSTGHQVFARHEHVACSWRLKYKSVIIYGNAQFVEDYNEKIYALNVIMKQYSNQNFEYSKPSVDNISILKVKADEITGRSFEY